MQKKIKKKVTKRQLREIFSETQQRQIRLDSANQIMAAAAQVLTRDFAFTPEQCVEFSSKVAEQIRVNNEAGDDEEVDTAVEEDGEGGAQ